MMNHKSITKWKKSDTEDYILYAFIWSSRKGESEVVIADQPLLGVRGLRMGIDYNVLNHIFGSGCTTKDICQNSSCGLKIGEFYCK